jgi:hypothetical protein
MSAASKSAFARRLRRWAEERGWEYVGKSGVGRMRLRWIATGSVVPVMTATRHRAQANARAELKRVERGMVVLAKRGGTVHPDEQAAR